MPHHLHTWLALGDSYTIGESLPLYENFPYQAVQLLRKENYTFSAPEIIARTGWTTDELLRAVHHTHLHPPYDIVSLLIGVNNQYRGYPLAQYGPEFELLLLQALSFAGQQQGRVFVLSIPDWGATPFAARDRQPRQVSAAIDRFNQINRSIADRHGVRYIDITPGSREVAHDPGLLAADQLHYSAREYGRWAGLLAEAVKAVLPREG